MGFGENLLTAVGLLCFPLYWQFAFQMLLLEFQTRFPTKSQEEIKWNRHFIPEVWRPWRDLRICTSENQNRLTLSVRFPGTRLLGLPESLYSLHTVAMERVNSSPHATDVNRNENSLPFPASNHYISKRNSGFLCTCTETESGQMENWNDFHSPQLNPDISRHDPGFPHWFWKPLRFLLKYLFQLKQYG